MKTIRGISLWQPWATAIALGSKRVETRHWKTDYRGPLVIHAAKRRVEAELIDIGCTYHWQGAMHDPWGKKKFCETLPFGALVAVCELVDCRPTNSFTVGELDTPRRAPGETSGHCDWTERQMGNFSFGRFGWVLENIRPLEKPVPYRGSQGFFYVDAELLREEWPSFGEDGAGDLPQRGGEAEGAEIPGLVSEVLPASFWVRCCRQCGCTDNDCSGCIERTGKPCHWVEEDLCSACVPAKSQA